MAVGTVVIEPEGEFFDVCETCKQKIRNILITPEIRKEQDKD